MKSSWVLLGGVLTASSVSAQSNGRLYDPEPPLNSAYVRVIIMEPGKALDLQVDHQPRVRGLARQVLSDYLVLAEGRHTISVMSPGQAESTAQQTLEVERGKSLTLAFPDARLTAAPLRFEDKGNTNRLKSVITAYNLAGGSEPITISTADGSAKVFTGLAFGHSASLQVNPIKVELMAADAKSPAVKCNLSMTAGATYSLLVQKNAQGKLAVQTLANTTERYTGP